MNKFYQTPDGEFLFIGKKDEDGYYEALVIGNDDGRLIDTCVSFPVTKEDIKRFKPVKKIHTIRKGAVLVDDTGNNYRENDGLYTNAYGETFDAIEENKDRVTLLCTKGGCL